MSFLTYLAGAGVVLLGGVILSSLGADDSSTANAKPNPNPLPKTPTLDTTSGRCSPVGQIYYVSKQGDTLESISQSITKNSSSQLWPWRDLYEVNPTAEIIFVFQEPSGKVVNSTNPPWSMQNSPANKYVGAFPKPGTKLNIPLIWNMYTYYTNDSQGWESDGKNVIYPPCGTNAVPLPPLPVNSSSPLQDIQSALDEMRS